MRVGLNSGSVGRRAGLGPAPTESPERRLPLRRAGCFHARAPGGPVCRPYKIRGTLRSFRRGRSQTGPGAALGRSPHPSGLTASPPTPFGLQPFPPDRGNRPSPKGEGLRATARVAPTQETNRERWFGKPRRKSGTAPTPIFHKPRAQWPGRNRTQALLILRAGNVLPTPRGNPRKWGPGKGDYEHEVLIWSRPRRRFGDFAAVGKVTRRPQAAKPPCKKRNCSIIAPSSGPFGGHLPQRGKAFLRVPSSGPFGAAFAQGEGLGGRPHGAAPAAETGLLERNGGIASPSLFPLFNFQLLC